MSKILFAAATITAIAERHAPLVERMDEVRTLHEAGFLTVAQACAKAEPIADEMKVVSDEFDAALRSFSGLAAEAFMPQVRQLAAQHLQQA